MAFVKNQVTLKPCGKVKYASADDAVAYLARRGRWAAGMSGYECGRCQAWHVGHTPGSKGRRRA